MFETIKARRASRKLARSVMAFIRQQPDKWRVSASIISHTGQTIVKSGQWTLVLSPCDRCPNCRLCDSVRFYSEGSDVFIPFLARIRLRAHVRWLMAVKAAEASPLKELQTHEN